MDDQPQKMGFKLHLRIDVAERRLLDRLADRHGLVHASGAARDAELVRVLLVSQLLAGRLPAVHAAVALRSNGVLVLSGELAQAVADLRGDIERLAHAAVGARPPARRPAPAQRQDGLSVSVDRDQVFLTLDDWLHAELERRYKAYCADPELPEHRRRLPTPTGYVRGWLAAALANVEQLDPSLQAYAALVDGVKDAIRAAARAGQETIEKALQAADPRKAL